MPTQIIDINEVRLNISRFQDILNTEHRDKPAFVRFSQFKDWYYDAELDAFGPGKFIGYRDTSVENYTGEGDGGTTHKVLAHFYDLQDPAGASYSKLHEKLQAFSDKVGKNIGAKFLTTGGIFVPKLAQSTVDPDELAEQEIEGRTDIGATFKTELVKSRRGQGQFRANVMRNESRCRITGVKDLQHLRASHIKPWRDCTDTEKLHGCNGLLLAPHIDHLFDRGFISFLRNGDLLVSTSLDSSIQSAWGLLSPFCAGSFNSLQESFLEHHRERVFRK